MLKKCYKYLIKLYKYYVTIYIMLFRDNNGNIVNISRLNYNNDKAYYDKLRNIIKTKNKEVKNINIENTSQYNNLLTKLL